MLSRLRARLSYANVVATLALFLALGGGAFAAVTLPKNSVKAKQIAKNAVRASEIKGGAVRSSEVRNGSLLAGDFAAGELPRGQKDDKGDKGDKGDPGDNVLAHAHINADGTFDPARSKDVLDTTVFAGGFTYCIDFAGIDFPTTPARIVQATLTTPGGNDPGEINAGIKRLLWSRGHGRRYLRPHQ